MRPLLVAGVVLGIIIGVFEAASTLHRVAPADQVSRTKTDVTRLTGR